jgi:hypothetical protein
MKEDEKPSKNRSALSLGFLRHGGRFSDFQGEENGR